jgi:hypothetical protein
MPSFHSPLPHVESGLPLAATGEPTLFGPFVVDYTDIPHDGDKKTLWTPQVGDVLLRLFPDPLTVVQWDHGTIQVGQGLPSDVVLASAASGHIALGSAIGSNTGVLDNISDALTDQNFAANGHDFSSTAYIFSTAASVEVGLFNTGGTDPTQGHVELYTLVARAVAP